MNITRYRTWLKMFLRSCVSRLRLLGDLRKYSCFSWFSCGHLCFFSVFASLKLIFWAILTRIRNNILYYTFLFFCIVLTVRFYFTIICRYGLRLLQLVEISTVEGLLVAVRAHHLLQPPCHLRTLFA